MDTCPKCGGGYNPAEDQVVMCPECGCEGSTACCNPGGAGCMCWDCEEEG